MKKFLILFLVLGFSIFASDDLSKYSVCDSLENGKTVQIIPLEDTGQLFKLFFSGFESNENLTIVSTSCEEKMSFELKMSKKGEVNTPFLPAVIGKKGGKGHLLIKTPSDEELSLNYHWGNELLIKENVAK